MSVRVIVGDCRDVLATLPAESVHCVVTSPPYFGLRDYGVAGQIGLESTFQEFVEQMVVVFREVRRVLRDNGTLWLNLGDSYVGLPGAQSRGGPPSESSTLKGNGHVGGGPKLGGLAAVRISTHHHTFGLKPKDICGVPWRVAFALQADGWCLRQDIIWSKPNPMPESVTDRCTKAHEYVFLLSKSKRYYYDAEAIKEPSIYAGDLKRTNGAAGMDSGYDGHRTRNGFSRGVMVPDMRNKRSVWEVPSAPFSEAHFATFPPALIEPCILAGCPKGGTVLDPFGGAGTTGLVADRLQRSAVLIELNPEYAAMAENRIDNDAPLLVACE